MNRKGSVLLQVMILGIIVAFLAAGMAAMLLMRGSATQHIEQGNMGARTDAGVLSNLLYYWNTAGVCSAVPGYSLTPGANSCSCTLVSNGGGLVKVDVVSNGGSPCQSAISITVAYQ